ncbi:MAG: hypothetical protein AAF675_14495 [Pseudomonadota bacterium]
MGAAMAGAIVLSVDLNHLLINVSMRMALSESRLLAVAPSALHCIIALYR